MPLAKAYEAEKKRGIAAARQTQKLEDRVSRRTRERLEIAEARHRDVLAGIEAQRDADAQRLSAKGLAFTKEAERLEAAAIATVSQTEAATLEKEAEAAEHVVAKQQAVERVA